MEDITSVAEEIRLGTFITGVAERLKTHRTKSFLTCDERCICWDIEDLLEIIYAYQRIEKQKEKGEKNKC